MSVVVKVENVSKRYQLGRIGTQSLRGDLQRWWARRRGREDPFAKVDGAAGDAGPDFWALREVSFEIRQGEALGIIGKNGAGKSTLLKILSRITLPTTGRVRVRGRIASLLEVGTGFNPDLTGRENIFLNGAILGMTKREVQQKLDEIIAFSGIERFIDTPVKRYSSGMYVRLAFSVAAHLESEILILDEVLAVGDAAFQRKCLGKMDDVAHKEGRTILFVSHGMGAIKSFCNRGLVFEQGRLVEDTDVQSAVNYYNARNEEQSSEQYNYVAAWEPGQGPRNADAELLRVAACDETGNPLHKIYTDTPFVFEIDFRVTKRSSYVGLTVILYDEEGNCILSSLNNLESNFYGKVMQPGDYKSTCRIPGNLLNNGRINVSINLFGRGYSDFATAQHALKMEIRDAGTIRGDYEGIFGGAIRPLLAWNTAQYSLT